MRITKTPTDDGIFDQPKESPEEQPNDNGVAPFCAALWTATTVILMGIFAVIMLFPVPLEPNQAAPAVNTATTSKSEEVLAEKDSDDSSCCVITTISKTISDTVDSIKSLSSITEDSEPKAKTKLYSRTIKCPCCGLHIDERHLLTTDLSWGERAEKSWDEFLGWATGDGSPEEEDKLIGKCKHCREDIWRRVNKDGSVTLLTSKDRADMGTSRCPCKTCYANSNGIGKAACVVSPLAGIGMTIAGVVMHTSTEATDTTGTEVEASEWTENLTLIVVGGVLFGLWVLTVFACHSSKLCREKCSCCRVDVE